MGLTTDEIEHLRYHLGFGNLDVGAYPYTPDGFFELFTNVIQPYLHEGLETSATTAIRAGTPSRWKAESPASATRSTGRPG